MTILYSKSKTPLSFGSNHFWTLPSNNVFQPFKNFYSVKSVKKKRPFEHTWENEEWLKRIVPYKKPCRKNENGELCAPIYTFVQHPFNQVKSEIITNNGKTVENETQVQVLPRNIIDSQCVKGVDKNFVFGEQHLKYLEFYKLLLDYQKPHVTVTAQILRQRFLALDASGTGTGKSFAAFGIAEAAWVWHKIKDPTIKPKIAIVCPKPILAEFIRLAKQFEHLVEIVFVCNIELLCRGKYIPWSRYQERKQVINVDEHGKISTLKVVQADKAEKGSIVCPYVKRIDPQEKRKKMMEKMKQDDSFNNEFDDDELFDESQYEDCTYEWKLPPYTTVIFDEAHKIRNSGTCFNQLVKSLVEKYTAIPIEQCRVRCVLASASILENAKNGLSSLMYLLGYIKRLCATDVRRLLNSEPLRTKLTKRDSPDLLPYTQEEIDMRMFHYLLYDSPKFRAASRMKIEQANQMFAAKNPGSKIVKSDIQSEAYTMTPEAEKHINSALSDLLIALSDLKTTEASVESNSTTATNTGNTRVKVMATALIRILRARQVIEHYKLKTIIDKTKQLHAEGWSIVIFLNFKQSVYTVLKSLQDHLGAMSLISTVIGGQKTKERDYNVQLFQQDKSRILITTIASGGASISLHDKVGNFPRYSLISPPISATQLKQVLGRCARSGCVTDSKQRLIFCKNTIEERVAHSLSIKIKSMDMMNDGQVNEDTKTLFEFADIGIKQLQNELKRLNDPQNYQSFTIQQSNFNSKELVATLISPPITENQNSRKRPAPTGQEEPSKKIKIEEDTVNSELVKQKKHKSCTDEENLLLKTAQEASKKIKIGKAEINISSVETVSGKVDWEKIDELLDQENDE